MNCHCCETSTRLVLPAVGGFFLLDDHNGNRVDAFSYGERLMLILFGFVHCAVVCPRELAKIDAALDQLGPLADRIQPLYITVDPERDTPAALKSYLQDRPRFVGLTGSSAEIDDVKRSFKVFAKRRVDPLNPDGYAVPHTTIAYLARAGGQVIAHFPDSVGANALADRLRSHLVEG